jgi:hypothetical protein
MCTVLEKEKRKRKLTSAVEHVDTSAAADLDELLGGG